MLFVRTRASLHVCLCALDSRMRSRLFAIVPAVWASLVAVGCGGTGLDEQGESESGVSADDGAAVRVALAAEGAGLPIRVADTLASDGIIVEAAPIIGGTLSRSLRDGIVGEAAAEQWYSSVADGGVLRVDAYSLKADVRPFQVSVGGKSHHFPLSASAGTRVEFARIFPSQDRASAAKRPAFWDVPADAERALALAERTYVTIPVRGEIATTVSGTFLSRAASFSKSLSNVLQTSAAGTLSGSSQGTLLAKGDFVIEVIRLKGSLVRLRVTTQRYVSGAANVKVSANGNASYLFMPATVLDRARGMKADILARNPLLGEEQKFRSLEGRLQEFKRESAPIQRLLAHPDLVGIDNPQVLSFARQGAAPIDGAIELATRASTKLEELDAQTFKRVDDAIGKVDEAIETQIRPVDVAIKRYAERTVNVSAAVALDADFSSRNTRMGDYVFDLSNAQARDAYERAVSGRAVWMTDKDGPWNLNGRHIVDLSVAEGLARADQGKRSPRVSRVSTLDGNLRKNHLGVTFTGLGASTSFNRNNAQQTITVTDAQGNKSSLEAHLSELSTGQTLLGSRTHESFASGFVARSGTNDPATGSYWFHWERGYGGSQGATKSAMVRAMNFLGPRAVRLGIPALYAGEHPGDVQGSVDVVISGAAIEAFFKAPKAKLWKALGDMADTYDNQFELPQLGGFAAGDDIPDADGARAACDKVAHAWGSFYCGYFRDRFNELPNVAVAQRLAYFEKFYKKALLANAIGTKVLVRFLSQVSEELGQSDGVYVRFAVTNASDDSFAASPLLSSNDSPDADVALSVLGGLRR